MIRLRRPGIVYCSTTRDVDTVYGALKQMKIPVNRYHGGMNGSERRTEQEQFMGAGKRHVMVATSAFGLGIDKRDFRYVVHFQTPASVEQYVQEAGRVGRDGKRANCILLHDSVDRNIHEFLLNQSRTSPTQLYQVAAALADLRETARAHPHLRIARGYRERWAAPVPRALDSGLVPWGDAGGPRREEHHGDDDAKGVLADRYWWRGDMSPPICSVRFPLHRMRRQFRAWETMAQFEESARGLPAVRRMDILYKRAAMHYHDPDVLYPLYAHHGMHRDGRPTRPASLVRYDLYSVATTLRSLPRIVGKARRYELQFKTTCETKSNS